MGEIGSGGGSSYPGAVDTGAVAETPTDFVRLDWGKDVEAAIVAIQAELGVDPAASNATVVARLDAIHSRGLASARPSPSATGQIFYFSTDLGILEYTDGTDWFPIMLG